MYLPTIGDIEFSKSPLYGIGKRMKHPYLCHIDSRMPQNFRSICFEYNSDLFCYNECQERGIGMIPLHLFPATA